MKKEELIKQIAVLEQSNKEWGEADLQRRKTLSQMLESPHKPKGAYSYDYSIERITYSWPEIYFNLGKLITKRDYTDFSDTISRCEKDISDLLIWKQDKKENPL